MCVNASEQAATDGVSEVTAELETSPSRQRLEQLLGRDLTAMLLAALSPRQTRRGSSSP